MGMVKPSLDLGMDKGGHYTKNSLIESSLIEEFGPQIGLTKELVKGVFQYRLKEKPNVLGVWISYEEAEKLMKDHLTEKKKILTKYLKALGSSP